MPGEASPAVVAASRRLRRKVFLALVLSGVLPLLVLVYVILEYVVPGLDSRQTVRVFGLHSLAFFTLLAMLGGAYIIWDIGRAVTRMGDVLGHQRTLQDVDKRTDEVGTLLQSFNGMLETIERQARDINEFAVRLDRAYKELETTNAKLQETSFRDDVTGLYNRRFFSFRLEEEISRHRRFDHPVSAVLLDLDGFKAINDELGHGAGDETLRAVAQVLTQHSRGLNVVSRYGGDEFAILLVETSKAGAALYAERIRQVLTEHVLPHGRPVTASFGVATLPDDRATTSEELIRIADEALYAAKRSGKNVVAATPAAAPEPVA